jgi:AcrR family transcriptional regulator
MSRARELAAAMPRKPAGKRSPGRPRQDTLSRERVLGEALGILDREGVEAITMRRLAEKLGVSAMAIYNHVSSKRDLLQGLAEQVVNAVEFASDHPHWQERIRTCFRRLRKACLTHPGVIGLLETIATAPPAVFRPMEITLAALAEAGVSPGDALKGYYVFMNFTLGQVSYEVRGPFQALDPAKALESRALPVADFAHIGRALPSGGWDFDAAFEFGLSTILSGLERRR